mgnify:CR=1 FL=1
MEPVIQFTLSQAWAVVLSITGGIVTIAAAVTVIIKIVKAAKRPNEIQNEEIKAIHKRQDRFEERLDNMERDYGEFFRKDKERLDDIEKGNRVIQRAILALLSHGIDGNDVDAMRMAKKELEEYLITK